MNFADLKNKHAGESVIICGTGPSLDKLEDSMLEGKPRIFLNRAAFALPAEVGKSYWLVVDDAWGMKVPGPWADHLKRIQDGSAKTIGVFRDPLMAESGFKPSPEGENIVHFTDPMNRREQVLELSREELASTGQLYQYSGTGATAIHLAWYMGASSVTLCGLDGGDGFAKRLSQFYTKQQRGGFGYWMAREQVILVSRVLKMKVEDLSEGV